MVVVGWGLLEGSPSLTLENALQHLPAITMFYDHNCNGVIYIPLTSLNDMISTIAMFSFVPVNFTFELMMEVSQIIAFYKHLCTKTVLY